MQYETRSVPDLLWIALFEDGKIFPMNPRHYTPTALRSVRYAVAFREAIEGNIVLVRTSMYLLGFASFLLAPFWLFFVITVLDLLLLAFTYNLTRLAFYRAKQTAARRGRASDDEIDEPEEFGAY